MTEMMVRRAGLVLLAALLAVSAAGSRPVSGATFHVSPQGNDAGSGTEAQPWKTLRKASASVRPGDTVRIKAGDYFEPSGWRVPSAGTAEQPIAYQAHGDGEVRITSSSVLPADAWTHAKGAIYSTPIGRRGGPISVFRNDDPLRLPGEQSMIFAVDDLIPNSFYVDRGTLYVWLEDGSDPAPSVMRISSAHVVTLGNCRYTIFDGLTVEYGYTGFKGGRSDSHITYRNCVIRSIANQGIQPVPSDSVIERNLFQKIGTSKFQHGIYNSNPGLVVRHNVFEEIAGAAIHQFHEGSPAGGDCQFYGNVFRKPRAMTPRSEAAGSRSPYYVEIIAWGEGRNRIYNNVFYGEGQRRGISLNSFDNLVAHNTFVGSASAIQFHANRTGNRVMNNIFQDAAGSFLVWPARALPQTLDYNIYHQSAGAPRWQQDGVTYQTFDDYRRAAGETHSLAVDPRLAGRADARLQPGSLAIDTAAPLDGSPITVDADGVPRPQGAASDRGAYEARPGP